MACSSYFVVSPVSKHFCAHLGKDYFCTHTHTHTSPLYDRGDHDNILWLSQKRYLRGPQTTPKMGTTFAFLKIGAHHNGYDYEERGILSPYCALNRTVLT